MRVVVADDVLLTRQGIVRLLRDAGLPKWALLLSLSTAFQGSVSSICSWRWRPC